MAFAASNTSIDAPVGAGLHVSVRATDVGASDLIPVDVHCSSGVLTRFRVTLLSGSGSTLDPIIYDRNSASAQFQVVEWDSAADSNVASEQEQHFATDARKLYVKATPDSGSDNVVLVQLVISKRA